MFNVYWSDISDEAKHYSMPEMIGDPDQDADALAATSPLALASQIKAPVLLAYGGRDRRVPIVHGEKLRDAMTAAGNPPQWIVYDDEGHGWAHTENRLDFWRRVEAFLQQHLK
jgi:dipeptidyl aminopeptidase/acylaminoacyl peptidase